MEQTHLEDAVPKKQANKEDDPTGYISQDLNFEYPLPLERSGLKSIPLGHVALETERIRRNKSASGDQ